MTKQTHTPYIVKCLNENKALKEQAMSAFNDGYDTAKREHLEIIHELEEQVRELVCLLKRSLSAYDIPNSFYLNDKSYEDDARKVLAKHTTKEGE